MILISFVCLQKICNFAKLRGCGSKIEPATPTWSSKFKRAWQAYFLSHILLTLEKYVFFIDLQMMLVPFFDSFNPKFAIFEKPILLIHSRPQHGIFCLILPFCGLDLHFKIGFSKILKSDKFNQKKLLITFIKL